MRDGGKRRGEGVGLRGIDRGHASEGAPEACHLAHKSAASRGICYGRPIGDQVGFARDSHCAAGIARKGHGCVARGCHRIGGVDAAGTGKLARVAFQIPKSCKRDDLGGVAAHDGGLVGLEAAQKFGAQATDADADRVEHPGLARCVRRRGRAGKRLLVHGKQRPHVDVDGTARGDEALALVR